MTEKKKSEAKKPATTQRFSDVAKELGIEVKALLALVDQFVVARPDFKDYVFTDGKKPAASSNFGKIYREEFLAFAADKLPKKAEPAPEPVQPAAEAPKAPEPAKPAAPVAPVAKPGTPPPVSLPPRPTIVATPPPVARPPVTPVIPRPTIAPTPAKTDLPPVVISNTPPPIPTRPANVPPVVRPPVAPIVNRPAATSSQAAPGSKGIITVRPPIVVRDFAIALNLKPFQVIGNLMELNKVVSVSSVDRKSVV